MSPEQEAQLRHLIRKSQQMPEPSWNLFQRTTKRFSRATRIPQPDVTSQLPQPRPQAVPQLEDKSPLPEPPKPSPSEDSKQQAYEDLGLPPTASMKDIRNAYLKMAMKHHPDKGGDPEMFKRVKAAYDKLTPQE